MTVRDQIWLFVFVLAYLVGAFAYGVLWGHRLERRRVIQIFQLARTVVRSGALAKVRRRIEGEYDDTEFVVALEREAEFREQEAERRQSMDQNLSNNPGNPESTSPVVLPPGPRNLRTGLPVSPFENAGDDVRASDFERWRVQIGEERLVRAVKYGYVIAKGPWQEVS